MRIIGGQWRGRKLAFPDIDGLRPTPDRVRETLFNWLAPTLQGARCLDLFAGSGALGLEALSRGAAHCHFVDSSRQAIGNIQGHLQTLDALERGGCSQQSALDFSLDKTGPWDIVFLDPPFGQGLVPRCCERLQASGCLASESHVYIETGKTEPAFEPGQNWEPHRQKQAGQVSYQLFIVHAR